MNLDDKIEAAVEECLKRLRVDMSIIDEGNLMLRVRLLYEKDGECREVAQNKMLLVRTILPPQGSGGAAGA